MALLVPILSLQADSRAVVDDFFDFDATPPPYAGPATRPLDDKEYIKTLERENARLMAEKKDAHNFVRLQLADLHSQASALLRIGLRVNCYMPQLVLLQRQLVEMDHALTFIEEGHSVDPSVLHELILGWQTSLAARTNDVLDKVSECNTTTACSHALDTELTTGPATLKDIALGRRVKHMTEAAPTVSQFALLEDVDSRRQLPVDLKGATRLTHGQSFFTSYFRSVKEAHIQFEMSRVLDDLKSEGHRHKHSTTVCPDIPQPAIQKAMKRVASVSGPSNSSDLGSWVGRIFNAMSNSERQSHVDHDEIPQDSDERERNIREFLGQTTVKSEARPQENLIQFA